MSKILIKQVKKLSPKEMNFMNRQRVKEFGADATKIWKKDYPLNSLVFFVLEKKSIVAFGLLRPVNLTYLNKRYNILGICSIISIIKKKGYGKDLIQGIIIYLKKTEKTGLGFTGKTEFFKKAGLGTKKNFIKRFVYFNPRTGKKIYDYDGDGIYYEGKDKLITRILSTKSIAYIPILHW